MQIEVDGLTEEGECFAHTYAPGELSLDEDEASLLAGTQISGRASRKSEQQEVRLRGTLKAAVEVHCDRCLRLVNTPVEVRYDLPYLPAKIGAASNEHTELQVEDLDQSFYEGDSINVDDLAREQILLALPIRLLCCLECKGLCATCAGNLNEENCGCEQNEIDPRWAALASLQRKDE